MKKIIITSLFFIGIISQNCFGQLKVDSVGRVSIGTNNFSSNLNIGGNGSNSFTTSVTSISGRKGIYVNNNPDASSLPIGLYLVNGCTGNKTTIGIKVYALNSVFTSSSSIGIQSKGGGSASKNIGVYGGLDDTPSNYNAGIYGSSTSANTISYSGSYAGYFNGDLRATGATYGTLLSPSPNSPANTASSLDMDNANMNVADKLMQLRSLQLYNNRELQPEYPSQEDIDIAIELGEDIPKSIMPVQTKMSSTRYAIDEESLRNLFPELVYEDKDGNVSINYIEMVPLLVQSIKELNAKIEELQGNDVKAVRNRAATSVEGTEAELFSVSQNEPNPFTETTTIKLSIPKKTQAAALIIYDMSGKQLKQININERGKTSVNITSEGFAAGMYLYSLIADGKVVNTKRMILTK